MQSEDGANTPCLKACDMEKRLLIVVCHNHEPELIAARDQEKFGDVDILTIPARCGKPPLTLEQTETYLQTHLGKKQIYVLGCSCISNLQENGQKQAGMKFHCLRNCFQTFADMTLIEHFIKAGYFLVTSGWVAHWRANMNIYGFDQQTAREFFAETTKKVLLLETLVDQQNHEHLQEFAHFIDRPTEIVPLGLGYFRFFLSQIVKDWRLKNQQKEVEQNLTEYRHQISEYAMAMDILKNLSPTLSETEIVDKILETCMMLFAPQSLYYLPFHGDRAASLITHTAFEQTNQDIVRKMSQCTETYEWLASGSGFRLRIDTQNELLGVLELDQITFPNYKDRYLNLALNMVPVWSLALINARKVRKIKETEQAMRQSEEKLSLIFHSSPNAITVTDMNGIVVECNPMTAQMLGYASKEEVIGRNVLTLIPEREHEKARENTEITLTHGYVNNVTHSHIRQDGSVFPVVLSAGVMRDQSGKPEGFVAITIDNTERMVAENERKKLLDALEQTADSVFITNKKGIIEYVNRAFTMTTGYLAREVIGQSPKILKSGQHDEQYYQNMWKTIMAGQVFRREIVNRMKNGELVNEDQTITPIKDDQGQISHFISAARDITEKKRIERLREDIERIVRHDLKTPLTSIMGYSQLLFREPLTDEQRQWADIIYNRGKQMLQMIDQSLDLYKMEVGIYQVRQDKIDLIHLFFEIQDELKHITTHKSLILQFFIQEQPVTREMHYMLYGEHLYLKLMLANLIKNALEASPAQNTITITVLDNKAFHSITIHNRGVIPESIRKYFFDKYSTQGKKGGTGLGTYSAYLIAKAHGGTIAFITSEQAGTTLTVRLPKNP
ncbi:PAS domain S-box protein [candidate division CSSED10-310 bacterium]|uniref:histidine kinase n=1 Tax=candidate division CSSED10-310 bacterium TaxID=2855610 RepID=A0ABV6YRH3_UNCC1